MKNINVGNTDILVNGDVRLSRKSKIGIIVAISLCIGAASSYGFYLDGIQETDTTDVTVEATGEVSVDDYPFKDDIVVPPRQEEPINVSLEEINSLNIVINDSNCRDDFIYSFCEKLNRDGIKFTLTKDCNGIDIDNSVVITLDQQYMAGPATVVFAPLENGRVGNSDALALAAEKAFYEKGFLVDGILCGQIGFRENDSGTVSRRVPTDTEEAIAKDKNTSFITISFGTQNTNPALAASSIEATLTRYYSYITGGYEDEDLIYCVEEGENYDHIAGKLGTTSMALEVYNDTADEDVLLTGETIINPIVADRRQFNQHVPTNLYVDKTLWSK